MYIYEHNDWPSFSWDKELVHAKLNEVYKAVGYLMGRLSLMGFDDKYGTSPFVGSPKARRGDSKPGRSFPLCGWGRGNGP